MKTTLNESTHGTENKQDHQEVCRDERKLTGADMGSSRRAIVHKTQIRKSHIESATRGPAEQAAWLEY